MRHGVKRHLRRGCLSSGLGFAKRQRGGACTNLNYLGTFGAVALSSILCRCLLPQTLASETSSVLRFHRPTCFHRVTIIHNVSIVYLSSPKPGRRDPCGRLSCFRFARFQIEGLKSHVQIHSKSIANLHLSQEVHACKNSKPWGPEETSSRKGLSRQAERSRAGGAMRDEPNVCLRSVLILSTCKISN